MRPWSRTSHIVSWLTPDGQVSTVVKGAVRPKSFFLGQYDLNQTCEILYYARAKNGVHALRECALVCARDQLRNNCRALCLASYFRKLVSDLAPMGVECRPWYELLSRALSALRADVSFLVRFELDILRLAGLSPDFSGYDRLRDWSMFSIESGVFFEGAARFVRVSREVAAWLDAGAPKTKNEQIPLDAARVIGVFYQFHLDCAADVRRSVLGMLLNKTGRLYENE